MGIVFGGAVLAARTYHLVWIELTPLLPSSPFLFLVRGRCSREQSFTHPKMRSNLIKRHVYVTVCIARSICKIWRAMHGRSVHRDDAVDTACRHVPRFCWLLSRSCLL